MINVIVYNIFIVNVTLHQLQDFILFGLTK